MGSAHKVTKIDAGFKRIVKRPKPNNTSMTYKACCYLQYETPTPVVAGLGHQTTNLRCLLQEAHATGRLAVLPALYLSPTHNFGVCRSWRWESYFDLDRSRLVDAVGQEHPLPIAGNLPTAGVRTLVLSPGEHMPARARDYTRVIRRLGLQTFRREVPTDGWPANTIRLRASVPVLELARYVLQHIAVLDGGRFAAVHVRRGDRLDGQYPEWMTEPAHIRKCLQDRGVAEGSVLFIASDERTPDFWRPLAAHYRLVRYVDFPLLESLVSGRSGSPPDNYLLYQVEREVMRSAWVRIGTLPIPTDLGMHGFLVREDDWSRLPVTRTTWAGRAASRWRYRKKRLLAGCLSHFRRWCPAESQLGEGKDDP